MNTEQMRNHSNKTYAEVKGVSLIRLICKFIRINGSLWFRNV